MPDFEERIMSEKLKELDGLSPDEILIRSGIETYPVNILAVLKKLGVQCDAMDFSDIEAQIPKVIEERGSILGAVTVIGDDVNIFYTKGCGENRMRFTVAHELAHCCLNAHELRNGHIQFRFDSRTQDPDEYKANVFAGKLLIPEKPLIEIYNKLIVPASDVMAREFKVSTHVMEARLEYLGLGFYSPINYDDSPGEL